MSNESGRETGNESLSEDRILHMVRVASAGIRRDEQGRLGARLAMWSLCVACLIVGSTAREITHWALGDTVFGPYAAHVARVEPLFRCGGTRLDAQPADEERQTYWWSSTDEAVDLPAPGR